MKRARTTFAYDTRVVSEGTEFEDDDPIVVGREELFKDAAAEAAATKTPEPTGADDSSNLPADNAAKKVWEAFADSYDPPLDVDKSLKSEEYKAAVKAAAEAATTTTKTED